MEKINEGIFRGKIVGESRVFETHNKKFVNANFETERTSGTKDVFAVTIPYDIFNNLNLDHYIELHGSIRSTNFEENGKTRLKVFIFVNVAFNIDNATSENLIKLDGFLAKKPIFRKTPFKREITDFVLAYNNKFGHSYYIPCICWESNARFISKFLPNPKQIVSVEGRLQSRQYQKIKEDGTIKQMVAYELSVNSIAVQAYEEETTED